MVTFNFNKIRYSIEGNTTSFEHLSSYNVFERYEEILKNIKNLTQQLLSTSSDKKPHYFLSDETRSLRFDTLNKHRHFLDNQRLDSFISRIADDTQLTTFVDDTPKDCSDLFTVLVNYFSTTNIVVVDEDYLDSLHFLSYSEQKKFHESVKQCQKRIVICSPKSRTSVSQKMLFS